MSTTEAFPMDWDQWRKQWSTWRTDHAADLKQTSWRFPGVNFCADERLGTWDVNGRHVELSEVTFTIGESVRYVGVTFSIGAGSEGGIADSFAELEAMLGIA